MHEPSSSPQTVRQLPLLITNDDGIESEGLISLVSALHMRGHPIVVIAPQSEQSATGMKLTLRSDMSFIERDDLSSNIAKEGGPLLRMFSLDGSPCDCVIVALEMAVRSRVPGFKPMLCVSGINHGPNVSVDVLHSGTVSAAREASLYGMPSIAVSLATYEHKDFSDSITAVSRVIDACSANMPNELPNLLRPAGTDNTPSGNNPLEEIRSAFHNGDILLNINIPIEWNGIYRTVDLGARWYRSATDAINSEGTGVAFEVGAAIIDEEDIPDTDCNALNSGCVSITPLGSWPSNHPLGVSDNMLASAATEDDYGLPNWL
ncbi:MAG: hypothetical protein CMB22_04875 [Euryarchaeota archaeon]|nr:hypothetical protein [Euryarchaeota archaeon]